MIKVFIDNKAVVFSESNPEGVYKYFTLLEYEANGDKEIYSLLNNVPVGLFFLVKNQSSAFAKFIKDYKVLEAAGGMVRNQSGELLMIYRFNKWDLPKGKIEKDETPEQAAVREVREETGVCDLKILSDEPVIMYHTYSHKQKKILKRTFWFNMLCGNFTEFKLQKEEDIQDAKWKSEKEVEYALQNSYASIIDLLKP
jgi:8-oxo-dGTP pyrophosphatase MutT (NUDIX family)